MLLQVGSDTLDPGYIYGFSLKGSYNFLSKGVNELNVVSF